MNAVKCEMKKEIHALDFAVLELSLYLDTHTWDKRALKKRAELLAQRAAKVLAYEEKFGPYIVTKEDVRPDRWSWVSDPWPWEYAEKGEM